MDNEKEKERKELKLQISSRALAYMHEPLGSISSITEEGWGGAVFCHAYRTRKDIPKWVVCELKHGEYEEPH